MVFLALLACTCTEPDPPAVRGEGVRMTIGSSDVRLEVPVRRLEAPGRPAVVLAGAVHVAEPALYAALAEALAGCAVVLREGLEPEPDTPEPQVDLGPLLASHGLVRQGEVLGDGEGWRRSDLSVAEVRRTLLEAGAGPELIEAWLDDRDQSALIDLLSGAADSERGSALVRLAMVRGLAEPPPSEEPEASLYWDIVIGLRNRAVIAEIPTEDEGPIGILYGADHLADLEGRLERRGWERQTETWLPAIAVRHDDLGLGPVQVRQLMEGARSGSLR